MPTLEITDEQRERIEALRADIADHHAGAYAAVGTAETLSYLLDLADAVDDPDRSADPERPSEEHDGSEADAPNEETLPFERETVRPALASRNRRHGDPDDADRMDLYTIAAEFDVTGRSEMTKDELVEGILDAAARVATDPFAAVGVDLDRGADETREAADGDSTGGGADAESDTSEDGSVDSSRSAGDTSDDSGGGADDDTATAADDSPDSDTTDDGSADSDAADDTATDDDSPGDAPSAAASDAGSSQLNAMMNLLDTHDDKWRDGDGDARYEVELPDGRVETARTKDDVRALLFRHY